MGISFLRQDRPARHASPQGEAGGQDVQDMKHIKNPVNPVNPVARSSAAGG
jgi:hypothetical protein